MACENISLSEIGYLSFSLTKMNSEMHKRVLKENFYNCFSRKYWIFQHNIAQNHKNQVIIPHFSVKILKVLNGYRKILIWMLSKISGIILFVTRSDIISYVPCPLKGLYSKRNDVSWSLTAPEIYIQESWGDQAVWDD